MALDNCIDCPHHKIVPDPDPTDWFCDDDVAVLCTKSENTTKGKAWKSGEVWPHQAVTTSCRPYGTKDESERPTWCPLTKEEADGSEGTAG